MLFPSEYYVHVLCSISFQMLRDPTLLMPSLQTNASFDIGLILLIPTEMMADAQS